MKKTVILILFSLFWVLHVQAAPAIAEDTSYEIVFWETIKDSKDPQLFQMYLDKYPNGAFAEIAELLIIKYSYSSQGNDQSTAPSRPRPSTSKSFSAPSVSEKKSRYNLAILPFKFYDDAHYMVSILLKDISLVGDRYHCLKFSHSYYQLDAQYIVTDLKDSSVISQSSLGTRNLWNGNTPNSENISAIGRQLGFDTVITGSLRVTNPLSDVYVLGYIRIYMVDVKTGKIFRAMNLTKEGDARDYLERIIQRVMKSYAGDFCH